MNLVNLIMVKREQSPCVTAVSHVGPHVPFVQDWTAFEQYPCVSSISRICVVQCHGMSCTDDNDLRTYSPFLSASCNIQHICAIPSNDHGGHRKPRCFPQNIRFFDWGQFFLERVLAWLKCLWRQPPALQTRMAWSTWTGEWKRFNFSRKIRENEMNTFWLECGTWNCFNQLDALNGNSKQLLQIVGWKFCRLSVFFFG